MAQILAKSEIHKRIENGLDDKKICREFTNYVVSYIDKNTSVLYHPTPSYRLFFRDDVERKYVYNTFKYTETEINDVINQVPELKNNWKILKDPFSVTLLLIIRNALRKKGKTSDKLLDGVAYHALMFLTLSLYSSLQYKYFRFPPNEDIMQYTINNIRNKFLFKQYGSVYKALEHTALVSHKKYMDDLVTKDNDINILNYLMNLRTRLNNLIKHFKDEYETNKRNKSYLAHETESNEAESYHENDSVSLMIMQLRDKIMLSFVGSDINRSLVRTASEVSKCEKNTLYNALLEIKDEEQNAVKEVILIILSIFFSEHPNMTERDVNSKLFFIECLKLFSKSNTNDKRILRLKELLGMILQKHCLRYAQTNREPTQTAYKKGVYVYFILFTQYANS